MLSAVCLGESMAMLTPASEQTLEQADVLQVGLGGAESNVAMGLAAMGIETHWIGRVGEDGFGSRILADLRAHSVGTTGVQRDPLRHTGLYVKVPAKEGQSGSGSSMLYYRQDSAASAMGPDLLSDKVVSGLLADARLIHLSGITPALSPDCLELCRAVLSLPRNGRIISFDVNWRPALWHGRDHGVLQELANLADVVLVGSDEAEHAFGTGNEQELRALLPDPEVLVIKNEAFTAVALERSGAREEVPALSVEVLEPVGAGDSFAAGYLSGMLLGLDLKASLRRGHISAACTLTVPGDRGPLPPAPLLTALVGCSDADWGNTSVAAGEIRSPAVDNLASSTISPIPGKADP
ncbi:sugar kinase [Arthrobacter sp. zg-Y750]|uniref:sugar kinase n=1 Tax=Arthrobacter sp. zg-Y750 TaxID=2894189 RepID=UPI002F40FF9A